MGRSADWFRVRIAVVCGIENPCFLTTPAHWESLKNIEARSTKIPCRFQHTRREMYRRIPLWAIHGGHGVAVYFEPMPVSLPHAAKERRDVVVNLFMLRWCWGKPFTKIAVYRGRAVCIILK